LSSFNLFKTFHCARKMSRPASVSFPLHPAVFCFLSLISFVASDFISQGSTTDFFCESYQSKGVWYEPILKRNDDHHKEDPINLFVGASPRPVIDDDWSVNKTENATTGKATFNYHLINIGFEDAGIYLCDDKVQHRKNVTVIGDRVICKDTQISAKEGDKIQSGCELLVDGPDQVDLAWYIDDEKVQSKLKEVKPEDHSVTTMLDLVAQPEHHAKKAICKYAFEGKVEFECEVPVSVTYAVQVKGGAKSVYHDDTVEAEILVIGNPWPGKSSITVASDDIIAKETTMDELDNGLGVEVTVHVPLTAFEKGQEVTVSVLHNGKTLTSVPIKRPEKGAKVTYIIVIVVLAIAALLLALGVIYFIRRGKSKKENISTEAKDVPLAEQAA